MRYWQIIWTVSVLVAGLAFAFVTVVVSLKGGRDLKEMFTRLLQQKKEDE
jgi:predicted PurR-regulated permease PerM